LNNVGGNEIGLASHGLVVFHAATYHTALGSWPKHITKINWT